MENIKLASHNSFTYLKPRKWYMRPFGFIARCQSKDIEEQYENYGVRLFDLRVAFDRGGSPHIRHGLIDYGYKEVEDILEWLDSKRETVYMRVILERDRSLYEETLFIQYCVWLEQHYSHIKFLEGVRKCDWKRLYRFGNTGPSMEADFSSVKGSKINDLWPWLYAKLHNKKAIESCKKKWLMIDFVEIR